MSDELVITRRTPLVENAPEFTTMTLRTFHGMAAGYIAGDDTICVGENTAGELVLYRVWGWDAGKQALALKLVTK